MYFCWSKRQTINGEVLALARWILAGNHKYQRTSNKQRAAEDEIEIASKFYLTADP